MSTLSAQELHEQGARYYYGNGVKADEKKAAKCFEQAIALGNMPESKWLLGLILLGDERLHTEVNGPSDWEAMQTEIDRHKRCEQLIEEAAAEGDIQAQKWYIKRHYKSKLDLFAYSLGAFPSISLFFEAKKKSKTARAYKKALLAAGDFDMLYEKAFSRLLPSKKLIEQLADKEYAPAEYTLGAWYTQDYPYKKDIEKAKYWLTRSAQHGSEPAKEMLPQL